MVYIDFNNDKEKKNLSTELEKINIDHNDILLSNNSRNSIIITDNDIDKVKEHHKNYRNIIIYNKNKDALTDKVYYDRGVYTYSNIEELNTIFEVIKKKRNNNINTNRIVIASLMFVAIIMSVFSGADILKGTPKKVTTSTKKAEIVVKEKEEEKEITDYKKENIVFYGDSITEMYPLDKFFPDYPVVNAGHGGYLSRRLLEEVDEKLLVYNPTKVFMLMGTNDLAYSDYTNEEIVDNVKGIVNKIREDRKNVKIYIESIYPVNQDINIDRNVMHIRQNKRIREINALLKEYCKEEKLTYINIFDLLKEEDGTINEDYTLEGLHINEEGYKVITNALMKYVKEA